MVGYRSKLELTLKQDGAINVKVPSCPVDLPYVIVMRALGMKSDKDIADAVSPKAEIQDLLEVSFDKASEAPTEKDALVYIGNRVAHGMLEEFRVKRAQSMLDWGLLPHLGKTEDRRFDKSMFMGEAACKLLELRLGWIEADDKDHYGNKVIKFAGQMLADLFRTAFRNLVRDMKYQLERTGQKRGGNVVGAAIRTGIITDKLNNAIATGNWGRGKVGSHPAPRQDELPEHPEPPQASPVPAEQEPAELRGERPPRDPLRQDLSVRDTRRGELRPRQEPRAFGDNLGQRPVPGGRGEALGAGCQADPGRGPEAPGGRLQDIHGRQVSRLRRRR